MSLETFHFLRPLWLLAALLLAPVGWSAWRARGAAGAWARACDAHLLRHLIGPGGGRPRRGALALFAAGWIAACVAMAGPTWERLPQPAFAEPTQTVLVLDLARSMDAPDLAPTRLARARFKLQDALARAEGAVGLVIYAEEPYAVTPLTDDPKVIAEMVPTLASGLMPGRGARLGRAVDEARALFVQAGAPLGRILVLADGLGDAPDAALEAARRAAGAGFPVSALGFGGGAGSLASLAEAGGGRYAAMSTDDRDLDQLLARGSELPALSGKLAATSFHTDVWRDMGAWLVLVPLALASLAFRRGWASALGFLLLALSLEAPEAHAAALEDWFVRPDQQAASALEAGQPKQAAALFEDPAWRAAAQYRSGDYAGAAQSLSGLSDTRSRYNLGNALARSGRLEQALAAYDEVLARDPDHADARFNRELVKKLLDQQKQQQAAQSGDHGQQGQSGSEGKKGQSQEPKGSDADSQGQSGDQAEQPKADDTTSEGLAGATDQASARDDAEPSADRSGGDTAPPPQPPDAAPPQQAQSASQPKDAASEEAKDAASRQEADASPQPGADAASQPEADDRSGAPPGDAAGDARGPVSEREQAAEQWLSRIPEDPGGLLREKLRRRYAEHRYGVANGVAR
jgi:Ca-activated chloride channel homolog